MAKLSTHVLNTHSGCPASGMAVRLERLENGSSIPIKNDLTNFDGRTESPLLEGAALVVGRYRLSFEVGRYFRQQGIALPDPAFLETVPLEFGIADALGNYHVPLLCSPWSYSTYRGS